MNMFTKVGCIALAGALAACAGGGGGGRGPKAAAAATHTIVKGNSHEFQAPPDVTLRVVAATLVQKGFAIEQGDSTMGIVKATRNLQDPKDANTNYHISASSSVGPNGDGTGSILTLAASQQTLLYRQGHKWSALPIVPIPIPTGKTYETVVTGEGEIMDPSFYTDFFTAVDQALAHTPAGSHTKMSVGSAREQLTEASASHASESQTSAPQR